MGCDCEAHAGANVVATSRDRSKRCRVIECNWQFSKEDRSAPMRVKFASCHFLVVATLLHCALRLDPCADRASRQTCPLRGAYQQACQIYQRTSICPSTIFLLFPLTTTALQIQYYLVLAYDYAPPFFCLMVFMLRSMLFSFRRFLLFRRY